MLYNLICIWVNYKFKLARWKEYSGTWNLQEGAWNLQEVGYEDFKNTWSVLRKSSREKETNFTE